jgi:hypothetical protein
MWFQSNDLIEHEAKRSIKNLERMTCVIRMSISLNEIFSKLLRS